MKIKNIKIWFLSTLLILIIILVPNSQAIKAEDNNMYIYIWVVDEKGNMYTNRSYDAGFKDLDNLAFPNHEMLNQYGASVVPMPKSASGNYRYYAYKPDPNYQDFSDIFHITEQFSIVKIQLAKKGMGETTGRVIKPGDIDYPKDPLNPTGAPENRVDIHGFVTNESGGVSDAVVTLKHMAKPERVYSMTTTTDANGYYYFSGVDEKRFGTPHISVTKDGKAIPIVGYDKAYYSFGSFTLLDPSASYNFGLNNTTSVYKISMEGAAASYTLAPAGSKVLVTADIPPQKQFAGFSSLPANVVFENIMSPVTSFTMPACDVTVKGNFKDNSTPPQEQPETEAPPDNKPGNPDNGTSGGENSNGGTNLDDENNEEEEHQEDNEIEEDVALDDTESKTLTLNKTNVVLFPKEKITLTAKVGSTLARGKIVWSTSNKKVASVDKKGKITAKKEGTVTINAKTSEGKKAACKITVSKVKLKAYEAKIKRGKTVSIKVKSVYVKKDKVKSYRVLNKKIATVSKKGVVKGIKKGKTKVQITMKSGTKAVFIVVVK